MNYDNELVLIVQMLAKDPIAKNILIEKILPKVSKNSYIGDKYNEELYEYIIMRICKEISNFKIYEKNS